MLPGRGGIIGVLIVAWFTSVVEKPLRNVIPNSIDIIVTPTLTLLITGFTTYFILQPVGGWLSDGLHQAARYITGCIGAAIGGAVQASFHVASIAMGVSGLPLTFLIKNGSVLFYLLGLVVAYGARLYRDLACRL